MDKQCIWAATPLRLKLMRRTKEEAEATRVSIIESALPLFARKGPTATSLSEVAKAADVTRGAIYWHFKNKWELLDGLLEYYTKPVNTLGMASIDEEQPDPLGKLRDLYVYLLENVATVEDYRRVFLLCARMNSVRFPEASEEAEITQRFEALMREKHQFRCITLRNAIRKGQLPEDLDVEYGATLISAMIEGIVFNWMASPERYNLKERAAPYVDAIISTLKTGLKQSTPKPD